MINSKKEKIIKVSTTNTSRLNVIRYWLYILRGRHKLQRKQENALSLIIEQYIIYSKDITNPKFIWKLVFDYDSKKEIAEKLGITSINLENYLTKMRQANVIIDNKVNSNYMPGLLSNTKEFSLHFNFNIVQNEEKKNTVE